MTERRFLIKAEEVAEGATRFSHPWNPNSEIVGTRPGTLVELSRTGVSLVPIPAEKESSSTAPTIGRRSGSTSSQAVVSRR